MSQDTLQTVFRSTLVRGSFTLARTASRSLYALRRASGADVWNSSRTSATPLGIGSGGSPPMGFVRRSVPANQWSAHCAPTSGGVCLWVASVWFCSVAHDRITSDPLTVSSYRLIRCLGAQCGNMILRLAVSVLGEGHAKERCRRRRTAAEPYAKCDRRKRGKA